MTSFDIQRYNEEMNKLDKTLSELNDFMHMNNAWGCGMDSAILTSALVHPELIFSKYLTFEELLSAVDCSGSNEEIPLREYTIQKMSEILDLQAKFMKSLSYLKKAYHTLFVIEDGGLDSVAIKTENASLLIMQQCANWKSTE